MILDFSLTFCFIFVTIINDINNKMNIKKEKPYYEKRAIYKLISEITGKSRNAIKQKMWRDKITFAEYLKFYFKK